MNKFSKILLLGSLLGNTLEALEFGSMGNVSASMGGAGVALKNSQWALYYNPALLGVDKKSRIAYSFGANIREKNLLALGSIDYKNLSAAPRGAGSSFGGAIGGAVPASDINANGMFSDVLKNLSFGSVNGIKNTTDIQNFMKNILEASGADSSEIDAVKNATSLEDASTQFKNALMSGDSLNSNGFKAFDSLKGSLLNAIEASDGDTGLLKGVVENLQPNQLGGLADLLGKSSSGDIGLSDFLSAVGGINISQGSDPQMNRFIQDVNTIANTLKQNSLDFSSQNGVVFQLGGKGVDDRGAIAIGVFGSAFGSANANFDPTHNQIIINSDSNYIAINVNNDGIGIVNSSKSDYDNYSIMSENANHQIHASGLILGEVPIGYGQAFSTPFGDFSIGFTLKYIFGMGYRVNQTGSFDTIKSGFADMNFNKVAKDQTFGIDFGLLYDYKGFTLGLVGKDLNAPAIKINGNEKIILDPQIRAGAAYQWKMISLALDLDLKPNNTLSYASPKSQMIGGGVSFDFKYIDFRFGSMYDFRSFANEGVILTGGINILGFLDVALQSNLKTAVVGDYKIPSYMTIKLGGGFSW